MKQKHKIENQNALDDLAKTIGKVATESRRRKLWRLHSELSRTSPGIQSARAKNVVGFVGVKQTKNGRYSAMAAIRGKRIHIGTFNRPYEAYAARAIFLAKHRDDEK
ncbi:MAG: hypothetical protein ACJAYC_001170 [Halieaceae bacterium]|jgi:hypothetical protein